MSEPAATVPPQISRRALGLGAAALLAGCGGARRGDRVSLWAMDVEGENARFIVPAFTRQTGIAVDLQWLAWSSAHEKLLTAFAGGSLPDLMMLSNAWLAEFAMIGALAPLPADAGAQLADQFPAVVQAAQAGGRSIALPWVVDSLVLYYRADLLAAAGHPTPPPTWDGFKAMLQAVRRRQRDGFAILLPLNNPDPLQALAAQQPEPLLRDSDTRGNFRSPGFRAALSFYASLFAEGLAPLAASTQVSDPVLELARGWIAVYPGWAWTRADLIRRSALLPAAHWATAAIPGSVAAPPAMAAGSSLAITRNARDPARAWALARFLTAADTEVRFHRVAGNLPARPSAWRDPALAADTTLQPFRAQLARAAPLPKALEWTRIAGEMQLIAERMVRGDLTLDAACAAMDARADALLAKRRWLLDRGRAA